MRIYNYTVIFRPLEEGGYDVIVPAIPEICTFGETRAEARKMAEDAIRCYLESALIREGRITNHLCLSFAVHPEPVIH
jgi:predicted RNase H-like HicB family nuclease